MKIIKQKFWEWVWAARGKHPNEMIASGRPPEEAYMDAIGPDIIGKLGLAATDDLLDIGCGGGYFLKAVRPLVNSVTATDKILSMVERAKKNLAEFPDIEIFQSDADKIQKKDASYDKILCYSVIQYFMDNAYLAGFFKEIHRLLKPGGRALIADIPDKSKFSMEQASRKSNWFPILLSRSTCRWFRKEEILKYCREAGLHGEILAQPESLVSHEFRFDLLAVKR